MSVVKNPCKVYIGNIPRDADEGQIEQMFDDVGKRLSLEFKGDFAFVEYADSQSAEEAIRKYDGVRIRGRRLIVEPFRYRGGDPRYRRAPPKTRERGEHRCIVSNLSGNTTSKDLENWVKHEKLSSVTITDVYNRHGLSEGVVEFRDKADWDYCIRKLDNVKLDGCYVRVYDEREYNRRKLKSYDKPRAGGGGRSGGGAARRSRSWSKGRGAGGANDRDRTRNDRDRGGYARGGGRTGGGGGGGGDMRARGGYGGGGGARGMAMNDDRGGFGYGGHGGGGRDRDRDRDRQNGGYGGGRGGAHGFGGGRAMGGDRGIDRDRARGVRGMGGGGASRYTPPPPTSNYNKYDDRQRGARNYRDNAHDADRAGGGGGGRDRFRSSSHDRGRGANAGNGGYFTDRKGPVGGGRRSRSRSRSRGRAGGGGGGGYRGGGRDMDRDRGNLNRSDNRGIGGASGGGGNRYDRFARR